MSLPPSSSNGIEEPSSKDETSKPQWSQMADDASTDSDGSLELKISNQARRSQLRRLSDVDYSTFNDGDDDGLANFPAARLRRSLVPSESTGLLDASAFDDFVELNYGNTVLGDVNMEDTFWYMKNRQWSRMYLASYGPQSRSTVSFRLLFFYVALYLVYLLTQLFYHKRNVDAYILEFMVIGLMSLACALVSKFLVWFPRIILLEVYLFFYFFAVFEMYGRPDKYVPMASLTVGLVIFTVFDWFIWPYVLRAFSRLTGGVAPKISVDDESEVPRYEIYQDTWFSAPYSCVYEGEMLNGRPHGVGSWYDTSPQGESLRGIWYEGVPIGPFESVESESRSILASLRIIYGTIQADSWSWLTKAPLSYGVATIETCVSGSFFKKFPICKFITNKKQCLCFRTRCTCLKEIFDRRHYIHINDGLPLKSITISIDRKNKRLHVPGHQPYNMKERAVEVKLRRDPTNHKSFQLNVDARWIPSRSREGLLFIHGIYHNLEDALKRFGHFLAMGHFPSHIVPLCWTWPSSSSPLLYKYAKRNAADQEIHREFLNFLLAVKNSGIEVLTIMCHSMGSRFFLQAFPVIQSLFKKKIIDNAMTDVETDLGRQSLPPGIPTFEGDGMEISNLILLNPDYEVNSFKNAYIELSPFCRTITIYADSRDSALRMAHRLNQQASLGANVNALYDQQGSLLDLDIIDTGELDSNVSSSRHGFFNVSRPMVDDLYDLIVNRNRAEDRSIRLKPYRSVYRFVVVPSSVMVV